MCQEGNQIQEALFLLVFPVGVLHVPHQAVPTGKSQLAPFVLTVVLFVVDLTVEQDVLYPGVGEAADAADDLAGSRLARVRPRLGLHQAGVDDVVAVEHLAAVGRGVAARCHARRQVGHAVGDVTRVGRPLPDVEAKRALHFSHIFRRFSFAHLHPSRAF